MRYSLTSQFLEKVQTSQAAWKRIRPPEMPETDIVQPVELPASFVRCHHAGVGFGDTTVFEPFMLQ